MVTVLLTGYEPFASFDRNPSALLARALDGAHCGGARVIGRVLPVDLRAMPALLSDLLSSHRPDVVLSLGLAAGTATISVERVAVNLADLAVTPDNAGLAIADEELAQGGPDALFATAPTRRITESLCAAGIPARLSYSAGTHLCNAALYHALCFAHTNGAGFRAGFLHLPLLPEQAVGQTPPQPSMSLETMRRAVEIAIAVCAG